MKEYANNEITVFWDAKKCIHSAHCVRGLPEVFDRNKRPWINLKGASSGEIMRVIDKCPSGAISYKATGTPQETTARIKVMAKGPQLVEGDCTLIDKDSKAIAESGPFALCRCGGSKNKPYCDGFHETIDFDDSRS